MQLLHFGMKMFAQLMVVICLILPELWGKNVREMMRMSVTVIFSSSGCVFGEWPWSVRKRRANMEGRLASQEVRGKK